MNIYRTEYPRPQLVRSEWINLNGEWDFEIDNTLIGTAREYYKRDSLNQKINVPFCPESKLSGVEESEFMNCVWYRKNIDIPESWSGKHIILNFGAVDYHTIVYVNGEYVGEHKGGYSSFCFDITNKLKTDNNYITVCAIDDVRDKTQPSGKQSLNLDSKGAFYTRTTGIWQTVWLECVNENYISSIKINTDISSASANIAIKTPVYSDRYKVIVRAFFDGKEVGNAATTLSGYISSLNINLSEKHLWQPGIGNLYDLKLELYENEALIDSVDSYFGLRNVGIRDGALTINDKKVFGRFVLDQGFYPDGIYTAPTDDDLKSDIINSMKLGFNGARLHEKIFEPRFLYWADKLGYLVWEEHANWGFDHTSKDKIYSFLPEWIEAIERDYNHPSIIGWCPFNETWDVDHVPQSDELISLVYDVTKKLDPGRIVIDTSGSYHVKTDLFDMHDYAQSVTKFADIFKDKEKGIINDSIYKTFPDAKHKHVYNGGPIFVSEYGGITWDVSDDGKCWGYGNAPTTEEEFQTRYKELTEYILNDKSFCAFCYTQLYDVEQEKNGIMTYDRKFKHDPEFFYNINVQKAAIEE